MVTLDFSVCPPRCFRQISVSSVSSCSLLNTYGSAPRKENDDSPSTWFSTFRARQPELRRAVTRDLAAVSLWDWGCGAGRLFVGGPAPQRWPKLVASFATRPHRIWQLSLPILVFFRRQRTASQPGPLDRRGLAAGLRLRRGPCLSRIR